MKYLKKALYVLSVIVMISCKSGVSSKTENNDTGLTEKYSVLMGETVLNKYSDVWSIEGGSQPKWSYVYGLVSSAMLDLAEYTGDEKYKAYAFTYADSLIDENGIIKGYKKSDYNIDRLNSGKMLFRMYAETGDQRYKTALDTLRAQLDSHPTTKIGGFWHKKRYTNQMWLDGLYMGGPFFAEYTAKYGDKKDFDYITLWYKNIEKVARDPKTGLLYHGWDESHEMEWSDSITGCSPNFWGRGMGWYGMALVDLLDFLPKDHPDYDSIVGIIDRLAEAVVKVQDPETGVWYQVLDQGDREGNFLEGSASAMFSYFLLKAVANNYIDTEKYEQDAFKAFEGTVKTLVKVDDEKNLTITPVCAVAGLGGNPYRDGSYEYYIHEKLRDNDPKAVGPFIMAAIQYEKLKNK